MEYRDEKHRLYTTFIAKGTQRDEVLQGDAAAPSELVSKWVRNFYAEPGEVRLSSEPRLLNRFSIGADPELLFFDAHKRYIYAEALGMDTLAAFGCDMSGRQAELRAKPSRFALDIVASLMEALRWMAATHAVNELKWVAAAYIEEDGHRDGCGGHVHFGRKRATVNEEVAQLDRVNLLLGMADVFDKAGQDNRYQRTKYGQPRDYRPQAYGYEYRTFPTWISDPWAAYLALVVSKLSILHRTPIVPLANRSVQQIRNLISFYRGLDDDALIAWKAMHVLGMPVYKNADIKGAWGVREAAPYVDKKQCYIPATIAPSALTRQEVFDWLTKGVPIPRRDPVPTWAPFKLPKGFHRVSVQAHVFNIPDVAMGLVSKGVRVVIAHGNRFSISSPMPLSQLAIRKRMADMLPPRDILFISDLRAETIGISIPGPMRESPEQLQKLKEILSDSTLFPVCRVEDMDRIDWSIWDKPQIAEKRSTIGRQIAAVVGPREVL